MDDRGIGKLVLRAAKHFSSAVGGVDSVVTIGKETIHLTLEKGRETGTALCGQPLGEWEGIAVCGLDFMNHPNKCDGCGERLMTLLEKAVKAEGLQVKKWRS